MWENRLDIDMAKPFYIQATEVKSGGGRIPKSCELEMAQKLYYQGLCAYIGRKRGI